MSTGGPPRTLIGVPGRGRDPFFLASSSLAGAPRGGGARGAAPAGAARGDPAGARHVPPSGEPLGVAPRRTEEQAHGLEEARADRDPDPTLLTPHRRPPSVVIACESSLPGCRRSTAGAVRRWSCEFGEPSGRGPGGPGQAAAVGQVAAAGRGRPRDRRGGRPPAARPRPGPPHDLSRSPNEPGARARGRQPLPRACAPR